MGDPTNDPWKRLIVLLSGDDPDLDRYLDRTRIMIAAIEARDQQWREGGDPMDRSSDESDKT